MTVQARLPLAVLELPELVDLGELDIRPRLANAKTWEGYVPATMEAPGRGHPVLARELVRRFCPEPFANRLVFDPFCGIGTFLVEAARLNCRVVGFDVSVRALRVAHANLLAFVPSWRGFLLEYDAAQRLPLDPSPDLILTSPVYREQNHHSGSSAGQEKLRRERAFKAQQGWWDADASGHLARLDEGDFWHRLGAVWRSALEVAAPATVLAVVTKDRVRDGEIIPFTRQVAQSIASAGWQLNGLHWRRLDPSNAQRFQIHHAKRRGRTHPLVDREDIIIARPGEAAA